ncbi:conserved Plasmodium protein, unknown function [Plasmodium knowlesi strain H]|uniref:Uncharacterized protein n=3 Tax=Plasmodium knowlesi TaxID=5850 RepID=A0A5K1VCW6_PLAKH|nr:conserved Plasmodium protein, unknown function [Plasmodium knowlesi strain H]OTN67614.1 Uncharacterized protein PKNOH_S05387700 [Plasmodium knowlesi]CAA9990464.1 conserved Plasmodium protein, unknown function [Plasmodium knowlesi strain H]SBO19672.1 conserved Plasmodium protein, unknown function [Plasmodium knowlesi strain H]SBO22499.1 conserved Plasmodium protein, unknown function [Plasmodium knowlesi strain H]VVS79938.1 conserved Plasmodium protein, unknown function [Plasmodium knowlesi s|eukprot:XP_002260850.1 hypothetical protein, conserved in Plasmodium species [Plasmodium knowlesi strain H]
MSAAAIGVENRYLMKNKKNNNSTCDNINVDVNHIIKDIYGFKHGRKRSVQFINDDTLLNNQDMKKIIKRIKIQDSYGNSSTGKHGQCDHENKQEEDSLMLPPEDATCSNSEDAVKIGSGTDSDRGSDSGLDNSLHHSRRQDCTSNNHMRNGDKRRCPQEYDYMCENNHFVKRQASSNNIAGINSTTESLAHQEENRKILSKQFELCIDNVLEHIRSCNEINQAKKIMIPLLSEFILNNFMCLDDHERIQNGYKINIDTLQKEKKVLISAVKTQYQKIIQLQKLVDSQKCEIKKKSDELNQIKAKVHQYFYDINNPNKRIFSILSPDVY